MPMTPAEFKVMLQQMTKPQLDERMERLRPFMGATIAERDRAIAQSPEKARFDELYEAKDSVKAGREGGRLCRAKLGRVVGDAVGSHIGEEPNVVLRDVRRIRWRCV